MFDILPASGSSEPKRARALRPSVSSQQDEQTVVHAGPRVVQLSWKLPARLRKPIREQLQQERAERRRRKLASVSFARKEIHTQPLLVADQDARVAGARVRQPKRFFNRGVEHHTGDVYAQGKPQLHVAAPPYVGSVAHRVSRQKKVATPTRTARPVSRPKVAPAPVPRRVRVEAPPTVQMAMPIIERDVPMKWQPEAAPVANDELFVQVEKPKRMLPALNFSLWPTSWFKGTPLRSSSVESQGVSPQGVAKKKRLI